MERDTVIMLLIGQQRSADLWIHQWERYRDAASVRNAALALGKIFGVYNVLLSLNGGEEDLPEAILQDMKRYSTVWDRLGVEQ